MSSEKKEPPKFSNADKIGVITVMAILMAFLAYVLRGG